MTATDITNPAAAVRPGCANIFEDIIMTPQDRAAAEEWLRMREAGETCLPLVICGDTCTGKTHLLERLEKRFGGACRAESPVIARRAAAAGQNVTLDDGYFCEGESCDPAQKYADAEQLRAVAITVLGWRGSLPPHLIHLHGVEKASAAETLGRWAPGLEVWI